MNTKKRMEKSFGFLIDYGFRKRIFSKYPDIEILFQKKEISITIGYTISIKDEQDIIKKNNINGLIENSFFCLDIILSFNGKSENILKTSFFNEVLLDELSNSIKANNSSIDKQINIYSEFIKNNIEILNRFKKVHITPKIKK